MFGWSLKFCVYRPPDGSEPGTNSADSLAEFLPRIPRAPTLLTVGDCVFAVK